MGFPFLALAYEAWAIQLTARIMSLYTSIGLAGNGRRAFAFPALFGKQMPVFLPTCASENADICRFFAFCQKKCCAANRGAVS